ncbi:hypothetical protein JCM15519_37150 [Fundidesulfovibrio butyratiphilus]
MAKKILLAALLVAVAFASPAWSKKEKTPTPLSSSSESSAPQSISNFGTRWLDMSAKERMAFIEGMASAFRVICQNVIFQGDNKPKNAQEAQQRFRDCMLPMMPYRPTEIVDAMTALYQDKANNILSWDLVYGIALVKIKGDPYEDNLAKLRQDVNKVLKSSK